MLIKDKTIKCRMKTMNNCVIFNNFPQFLWSNKDKTKFLTSKISFKKMKLNKSKVTHKN